MGYISLAVLYCVFAITNFFAPTILRIIGPRVGMVVSGALYCTYTLVAPFPYAWAIILSSIFVGFAASILWVSQGNYLTRISGKNMGVNSGIFLGIFFSSMIVGNLIAGAFFTAGLSQVLTFGILFCVGAFGVFVLCWLRPAPPSESDGKSVSIIMSMRNTFSILFDQRMILISGLIIYSGYSSSIFLGKIPELIGKDIGESYIGWTMVLFGTAEFIGSIFHGIASDKLGKRPMIIFTLFSHLVAIVAMFYMNRFPPYMYFISTFLNGFADSGMNTNIYSILGNVFKDKPSEAFAAFKLIQSLSFTFGFIACIYLPFFALQVIGIMSVIVALYLFLILDFYVEPVE